MENLEKRVRQLEVELTGTKFMNALLMDKLGSTIEELKAYAEACLDGAPESEKTQMCIVI